MTDTITIDQFAAIDVRAGTVVDVADFPEARKPAWKLAVDLGPELGTKRSSAQVTDLYASAACTFTAVSASLFIYSSPP